MTSTQTTTNTVISTVVVTSPSRTLVCSHGVLETEDDMLTIHQSPTTTVTPHKTTTTLTKTMATVKKTKYTVSPLVITKTHTATCSVPPKQPHADPTCTITPTLVSAAALSTSAAKLRYDRRVPADRAQRIAERKARLEAAAPLRKRSPDQASVTVTGKSSTIVHGKHVSTNEEWQIRTVSIGPPSRRLRLRLQAPSTSQQWRP